MPSAMRLLVRFVVLVATVSGVGLAFAWAWDSSDAAHGVPSSRAPVESR